MEVVVAAVVVVAVVVLEVVVVVVAVVLVAVGVVVGMMVGGVEVGRGKEVTSSHTELITAAVAAVAAVEATGKQRCLRLRSLRRLFLRRPRWYLR